MAHYSSCIASAPSVSDHRPVFLHAGYSYGAMVTMQAPSLGDILAHFSEPRPSSAAAEICSRAQYLATQLGFSKSSSLTLRHQSPRISICVGGNEDRRNTETYWSIDKNEHFREQMHDSLLKTSLHQQLGSDTSAREENSTRQAEDRLPRQSFSGRYTPAYLLVSPLQGLITKLATVSFLRKADDEAIIRSAERKLIENNTLALFGDQDIFVSVKLLRQWSTRLENQPNSSFRGHEVSSASHFWAEENVAQILKTAISTFTSSLLSQTPEAVQ